MRAKRTDANHRSIVKAYRQLGCSVADTSGVGNGFPDLVIGCARKTALVEIKTDKGKLKASQTLFASTWGGDYIRIIRNADDVLNHVYDMRGIKPLNYYSTVAA